jgi:hypothetical protein
VDGEAEAHLVARHYAQKAEGEERWSLRLVQEKLVELEIVDRISHDHTPVDGSWLNMTEIELSVLARQALSGRLPTLQGVQERVAAWQERRNQQQAKISWRFITADARIKLKRLYPSIEA